MDIFGKYMRLLPANHLKFPFFGRPVLYTLLCLLLAGGCTTCPSKVGTGTVPHSTNRHQAEASKVVPHTSDWNRLYSRLQTMPGPADEEGLTASNLEAKIKSLKGKIKIVISKSERRLYLFEGERLVKSYPVGLGKRPQGDKVRQGDKRTPDGVFYVCTKNPKSRFHLSLGISYPTIEDAERGLRQGLISKKEYREIVAAIKKGRRPPWNTALGGAICIHGGGSYWDWTDGCIALNNKDIEELFRIIPVGTPIVIVE